MARKNSYCIEPEFPIIHSPDPQIPVSNICIPPDIVGENGIRIHPQVIFTVQTFSVYLGSGHPAPPIHTDLHLDSSRGANPVTLLAVDIEIPPQSIEQQEARINPGPHPGGIDKQGLSIRIRLALFIREGALPEFPVGEAISIGSGRGLLPRAVDVDLAI